MKALTVLQPYAGWIASRNKTIETRTWQTKFRGDLLICSGQRIHSLFKDDYKNHKGDWQNKWLNLFGKALCIVCIEDCKPMTFDDEKLAMCEHYPGAWSWYLSNIRQIKPFDIKGQLGLFDIDDSKIRVAEWHYNIDQ